MKNQLIFDVYTRLYDTFGPQSWWPGESRLEVIIGAILTQNTAWTNVERAIDNLKNENLLELEKLYKIEEVDLALLIRPSGYYNLKAERLKNLLTFIIESRGLDTLSKIDTAKLRMELLKIKGVGEETADSILLYAFERLVFVVDAYTKRIFSRLKVFEEDTRYQEVQSVFEKSLPQDSKIYNEYHAIIVNLGKNICTKNNPKCNICPIQSLCGF